MKKDSILESIKLIGENAKNRFDKELNDSNNSSYWSFVYLTMIEDEHYENSKILESLVGDYDTFKIRYDSSVRQYTIDFKEIPFLYSDNRVRFNIYKDLSTQLETIINIKCDVYEKLD